MSLSGKTSFITPRSSYRGVEGLGAREGGLIGLAIGPAGGVWFTRESGEVGKIEPDGRTETVTNRLVNAYGIAFDRDGRAWVGEGPGYAREELAATPFERNREAQMALPRSEPARLAEIEPSGQLKQFPTPPACRVPSLLRVERSLVWLERTAPLGQAEEPSLFRCEHRIRLTHATIRREGRRGRLFVIAQHPAPGRRTNGYVGVSVTLAVPRTLHRCGVPWPFKALFRSRALVVWRVATKVPEQEEVAETYRACVRPDGGIRVVARATDGESDQSAGSILRMRFAGPYLAYVNDLGSKDGGRERLTVENVANGSSTEIETDSWPPSASGAVRPEPLPDLERFGLPVGRRVLEMALADTGDVAWVGRTEATAGQPEQSVLYLHDRRGTRRLEVARKIESLRFSGSTLSWQAEGRAQSAPS
jgi:hypothetical protein